MAGTTIFNLLGKLAIDGVDETNKALKEVSEEGENTKNKLTVSFQDIGNKAGEMANKFTVGVGAIVAGAIGLVEGSKELRQDLGKLETAFETLAVDGAAQGTKTFKELYAVLGEDDTAIEAANNLVALTGDTQQLGEWTNILTGVYASFGDSLPIEGLAEAANETARTGAVTGGLADAINWAATSGETFGVKLKANTKANEEWNNAVKSATTSEEFFNLALQDCATAAEREQLIRETLNGLYGESAELYKQTNESVMANNTAQADMNLKMAEMAEKIEPIITKGKILIAEVLTKIEPFLTWAIDNINILAPIVLGFIGSLYALNIASKVQKFIPIVKTLFTLLKANPIGIVITVIGLLVTAFITLWNKCEGFRNFWINLGNTIKNTWNNAVNGIKSGIDKAKGFFNDFKNKFEETKNKISRIVDTIKGLFNFTFKTPKIKVPKFTISPSGWKVGDLLKGSIPKLGIDWYAKAMNNPMLLEDPTAFGFSPSGNIRVGGEAGDEIVGGANTIMGMISDAVNNNNGGIETKIDKLISLLSMYLPTMSNQQVVLSTGELVGALTSPLDKSLGQLANDRRRGR